MGEMDPETFNRTVDEFLDSRRFKWWKKHVRDLYQISSSIENFAPCQSCELLPHVALAEGGQSAEQYVLTGTYSHEAQNFVEIRVAALPCSPTADLFQDGWDPVLEEAQAPVTPEMCRFDVPLRYRHDGKVLQVRHAPLMPTAAATAASLPSAVYLFDLSRGPTLPNRPKRSRTGWHHDRGGRGDRARGRQQDNWEASAVGQGEHVCAYITDAGEVSCVAWARQSLFCSEGNKVQLFDPTSSGGSFLQPCRTIALNTDVEYIQALDDGSNVVCVATENEGVQLLDTRAANPLSERIGNGANCLDVSIIEPLQLLLGTINGIVEIHDIRAPGRGPLMRKEGSGCHSGPVTCTKWSPHDRSVWLSAGVDGDVVVWRDEELLFTHSGHSKGDIVDGCWSRHPLFAGTVFSVDPLTMIAWKPRNRFWE